jgi:hypothetical protein
VNIKEKILERKGLTSYNKKLKEEVEHKTSYLPKTASYKERCYLILNDLKSPPRCKITSDFCYFNNNTLSYNFYSKEVYDIIKHHLKSNLSNFLNIETICNNDDCDVKKLSILCSGKSHSGFMFKTKQYFSNAKSIDDIRKILLDNQFNSEYVDNFLIDFSTSCTSDVIKLCQLINDATSVRNIDIRYYILRGFDEATANTKLTNFFKRGSFSIEEKRNLSDSYNKEYIKQRIKNRECNKFRSRRELEIINILMGKYKISNNHITQCSDFKETKNKAFMHDIYVNDTLIIEYNGSYWHNDILYYPNKKFKDYLFEIQKAKYVINKNNVKYLIIWEGDQLANDEILSLVDNIINSNDHNFYSSRELDMCLYRLI